MTTQNELFDPAQNKPARIGFPHRMRRTYETRSAFLKFRDLNIVRDAWNFDPEIEPERLEKLKWFRLLRELVEQFPPGLSPDEITYLHLRADTPDHLPPRLQ